MGVYDKFQIPKVNQSGFVFGYEFNDAMAAVKDAMRFVTNGGAYEVHPSMRGGAFPTIAAALGQAAELPAGAPVIIALLPGVDYNENVVVPSSLAANHDIHFVNAFADYTVAGAGTSWSGSLTIPATAPWSARSKVLNLNGVNLSNFVLNLNSGWDVVIRNMSLGPLQVKRTNGVDGCSLLMDQFLHQSTFSFEDLDAGPANSVLCIGHGGLFVSDTRPSFKLIGSYRTLFVMSHFLCQMSGGSGAVFDCTGYTGIINPISSVFNVIAIGANLTFAKNCGSARIEYDGLCVIQLAGGALTSFDMGAFGASKGMPLCRLAGVMPTNPTLGTKASNDTVDYRDLTWTGAAWL